MKMKNYSFLWVLILPMMLFNCKKEGNIPIGNDEMWNCHHALTWDSLNINNTLIGEWEWVFIECYSNSGNDDTFKGMEIEIKSDHTLEVKENGEITQTSDWKVGRKISGLFELDVTPSVNQLQGWIFVCDNLVEFKQSFNDGCDNYFNRVE